MFIFPTVDEVIQANKKVLKDIPVKKGDRHQVLSRAKVEKLLRDAQQVEGDVYEVAAFLLEGIIRSHAYGSGNRRTAWVVMRAFLLSNGAEVRATHDERVFKGIREGFYKTEEINEWLKGNGIREFRR